MNIADPVVKLGRQRERERERETEREREKERESRFICGCVR